MDKSALKKIRWGIIGCGDVTEVKSGPGFRKARHSSLTAVMRRNGSLAKDYALRHGVGKWYENADELIEGPFGWRNPGERLTDDPAFCVIT